MQQQRFDLPVGPRTVPGVLFFDPARPGPAPLVLAQHGGSGHKLSQEILDWAEVFTAGLGFVVAAIDGPVHGARRAVPGARPEDVRADFFAAWKSADDRVDSMIEDWRAAIGWLARQPQVDASAIGFVGVSMGTAYGLPLVAAEPRIRAAVLGMWGSSFQPAQRLERDATRLRCPVLFQQKLDDELFSREGQAALFDRIGAADKVLCAYPGGHVRVQGRQLRDQVGFIAAELNRYRASASAVSMPSTPADMMPPA